eukprot:SAG31_NODE_45898_length_256_cov_7.738854_1_plen_32_part_01
MILLNLVLHVYTAVVIFKRDRLLPLEPVCRAP